MLEHDPGAPTKAGARPHGRAAVQRLGALAGAGNRAIAAAAARHKEGHGAASGLTVQRHSSWEHAMMGDTRPSALRDAIGSSPDRIHVLWQEQQRVEFFNRDATRDPRSVFPDIRWMQLAGSQLWLSYGEMNALADYLPNADVADGMSRADLIPVLQRMRQGIAQSCRDAIGAFQGSASFTGAAWSSVSAVHAAAGEVAALDSATAGLGQGRYSGLLARNACHFAPMSWERWALYHNEARTKAEAHHASGAASQGGGLAAGSGHDNERQAWLQNGYADHFVQDSFAAGHLVNKTLVMQWFIEFVNSLDWAERPWFGLPRDEVMSDMTEAAAPGVAGRHLYGGPRLHTTSSQDRATGRTATDPQTAHERTSSRGRELGSGAASGRYDEYGDMLNSAFLQKASGAVHDWFNERGLSVKNANGDQFNVGGDDTYLSRSGALGAELAARAAHQSQQAITEILATGTTGITQESIFALVPTQVRVGTTYVGLEAWNDSVVRDLCFSTIFPEVEDSFSGTAVRAASSEMVEGGVTR